MKILIIGAAGKMGKAVVSYLANDPEVSGLGLLDVHVKALRSVIEGNRNEKFKSHPVDIEDVNKLKEIMKDYDVGVVTLPNRKFSYQAIEAAIGAGLKLVDILEEYHRKPDSYETEGLVIPSKFKCGEDYGECLHDEAVKKDVLILDGMGFAPGLSNITVERGIGLLDVAKSAVARVGGIPNIDCCAKHPLRYMTTWSIEHVLREYFVKTRIIKDGNVIEIQSLSEPETFEFREFGIDAELECAITPGMPSFVYTHPELEYFAEKTIRWPGHYQGVRTLIECGLFDEAPVEIKGVAISPREYLLKLLNPLLLPQSGDNDACVMYNTVIGMKGGSAQKVEYTMWVEAAHGFTAMARVTAFTAAIGAKMVGLGKINASGIRAPEECVLGPGYDYLIAELGKCGIFIVEKVLPIDVN